MNNNFIVPKYLFILYKKRGLTVSVMCVVTLSTIFIDRSYTGQTFLAFIQRNSRYTPKNINVSLVSHRKNVIHNIYVNNSTVDVKGATTTSSGKPKIIHLFGLLADRYHGMVGCPYKCVFTDGNTYQRGADMVLIPVTSLKNRWVNKIIPSLSMAHLSNRRH